MENETIQQLYQELVLTRAIENNILDFEFSFMTLIACAAAYMAISVVWYSPKLFGGMWLELTGKKMDELKAGPGTYFRAIMIAVIISFTLTQVYRFADATYYSEVMAVSVLMWFGLIVPTVFSEVIWEKKNQTVFLIYVLKELMTFLSIGVIYSYM